MMYKWSHYIFFSLLILALAACEDLLNDPGNGDTRSRIAGTWKAEEDSEIYGQTTYLVVIDEHATDSSRVYIDNIYNVDATAEAVVSGRSISIPEQTMEGGFRIYGTGSVSGSYNQITWQYTIDDGSGELDNVSAVYKPF